MPELSELGQAALEYAKLGYAVIALKPRDKTPITPHGLDDWTDDPESVRGIWSHYPDCNIGIVCGKPSLGGLVVLDIDQSDEKDGYETLREWTKEAGDLPETVSSVTGSGGMHYLYRTPPGVEIGPSVNADKGVDIRGERSYIVAPPSVHPSGRRYEWEVAPDEMEPAIADENVLKFISHVQRNGGADGVNGEQGKKPPFALPESIGEGGRNDTLHKYASSLQSRGRSDAEIEAMVQWANQERCKPPLERAEVSKIVHGVCNYKKGEDRSAKKVQGEKPWNKGGRIKHNILAQKLMERHPVCKIGGALAVWTGARWNMASDALKQTIVAMDDEVSRDKQNEVVHYVNLKCPTMDPSRDFDGHAYVQFLNGTYDATDGVMVEPKPSMLITNTVPVEFDLDAQSGLPDRFLESVADGDPDTITMMQEVVAACMCSGRVVDQSVMLIGRAARQGGEASNGKSTFLNALRALLGPDNVSSLDMATLGQRFQAAHIVGKLANIGDDIPNGFLKGDELSIFKKIVTGDTIYSDIKGADGFEFVPMATLVFSMNSVPRLSDTTEGVFRRLAFLPFRRSFRPGDPDFDPKMLQKLTRPESLKRLALLGARRLQDLAEAGRFTPIQDMAAELEEVRIDNDSILRWIDDMGVTAESLDHQVVADVYARYLEWCKDSGERAPYSRRRFSAKLTSGNVTFNVTERNVNVTERNVSKLSVQAIRSPTNWTTVVRGFVLV